MVDFGGRQDGFWSQAKHEKKYQTMMHYRDLIAPMELL